MKTLADCHPGDIVVINENGVGVFVCLGNLLVTERKVRRSPGALGTHSRTERRSWCALVDDVDPEKLCTIPGSWHGVSPDVEVLDVVETGIARRENAKAAKRARWERLGISTKDTEDIEVDPMLVAKRSGW